MSEDQKALEPTQAKPAVPIVAGVMVPQNIDGMWRLAAVMASSGLMPKGMDKTETVFVAVQMGMEVGLSPMQAVQNIAVINGRPVIWGDAGLALVESSKLLESFDEYTEGEWPKPDFKAVCVAVRRGRARPIKNEFSIQDSIDAGLWKKAGPWSQYPKRMLKMRARWFTLRDGFSDVLKGLHGAEEAIDNEIELFRQASGTYAPREDLPGPVDMPRTGQSPDQYAVAFFDLLAARGVPRSTELEAHISEICGFYKLASDDLFKNLLANESELDKFIEVFRVKYPTTEPPKRTRRTAAQMEADRKAAEAPVVEAPPTDEQVKTEKSVFCPISNDRVYVSFCNTDCEQREGCPSH